MFKKFFDFFPAFFITFLKLFFLELSILTLFRVFFFYYFRTPASHEVDTSVLFKTFVLGFEFDAVATTYALVLPAILLVLNDFFFQKTRLFHWLGMSISLCAFWLYTLVSTADLPYYRQFNSHLNKQAFLWTDSPGFVLRLIFGSISYYGYLVLFFVFAGLIYLGIKKIYADNLFRLQKDPHRSIKKIIVFILFIPLLVLGVRGRTSGKSVTHEGLAIVSDDLFVNQVALNPNFTLFRSLFFQKAKEYTVPANIDESLAFARNYLGIKGPFQRSVEREQKSDSAFMPYNIIIVCMESMSSYKTKTYGDENLTPSFNNIIKESLYFDRFFSSGIHTFNGLFSTCTGFPGVPDEHSLRRYTRKPFATLGNLLRKKNYESYFFCTHDPHFDNMQGFFKQNGYEQIHSSIDFPEEKNISATGVPDHELYNLVFSVINKGDSTRPFIGFIMTGSDHGPWKIPMDIPFKPAANKEEKRSVQYADWAIGEFMKKAKQQEWYSNTLFVFLGDHGCLFEGMYEMPISYNYIPFVLHKPNTLKADTNHNLGYQPDVLSTVAGILNLSFTNKSFGQDIRKEKHPFIYFTADDKIGAISEDGYFFYNLVTQRKKRLKKYVNLEQKDYYLSQKAKADSLEKGTMHLLDAAEYFIRKEYFSY